jgi:hypothetical protein
MFKENIFFFVLVGFVLVVCLKIYTDSEMYNLKCVISEVDGNRYCVRDRVRIEEAADLIATATNKCTELVDYMHKKYPKDERVIKLVKGYNPKSIRETLPNSELTAYSENKGEKIALCLNKTKHGTKLIDINTLVFVATHELAHIMTLSIGHKQEFWQNFKFLLENAKDAKIYKPVDYKKNPENYCGITITDNPLHDM